VGKLENIRWFRVIVSIAVVAVMSSCVKNDDSAGYEYMPDMYRSPTIEAYTDYGLVGSTEIDSLKVLQTARIPADGTIPYNADWAEAKINMPWPYENNVAGYEAAGTGVTKNVLEATKENKAEGGRLYAIMCVHCHGEEGKGDGAVVIKGGHAPPGAYDGPLKDLSIGKMFHTLTYGKGMMGSHASQLSKKERWQVLLHVQQLQGGEVDTANGTADSLNIDLAGDFVDTANN
jgi:mono/diheme cytochrome c family protein